MGVLRTAPTYSATLLLKKFGRPLKVGKEGGKKQFLRSSRNKFRKHIIKQKYCIQNFILEIYTPFIPLVRCLPGDKLLQTILKAFDL